MVRFYDAPAVIIIVVDKLLQGAWPVMDIGLVSANIVLYAQDFGLGTCIMRAIVDYPEKIREIVGIPEQKRIYTGIAVGYPDPEHPVNQVRTDRESIENIVTWVD
jgi:nitroreductase